MGLLMWLLWDDLMGLMDINDGYHVLFMFFFFFFRNIRYPLVKKVD